MITHTIKVRLIEKASTNRILQQHWGYRKEMRDEYAEYIYYTLKDNLPKIDNYPVIVKYDYYIKGRQLDWNNHSGMTKLIEDTIIELGVLKDDSPKYIRSGVQTSHKLKDKNDKEHVIITIYEPEAGEILDFKAVDINQ